MKNIIPATLTFSALLLTACAGRSAPVPGAVADANEELIHGNDRFVHGESAHPRQGRDRRLQLSTLQQPHTIVLSCSDSRVPPEIVFDQGLGDLFTIRTAGEVPDSAALASIEYAVEHLGVKQIVVLGHERCGAVKAALETPAGKSAGSEHLDALVGAIRPNLTRYSSGVWDSQLRGPVKSQVEGVAKDLTARSKIIAEHVEKGELKIVRAIYALEDGEVERW